MELDAVERSYARWAPVYDATFGAITQVGRRAAVGHVNARGGTVLELGVGTGLALAFYGRGVQVTGVDYSDDMLKRARARVARLGLENVAGLRQMDARALDFPDESFDMVAAMHVLSVVPEPERVMAEIARVLRPGGQVVISNHFRHERGAWAALARLAAPLENLLGWHSDFEIATVLANPALHEVTRRRLPPLGLMTLLVLEKRGG